MILKHFFDISTGFRYKKKWKRVLRPSIETSMPRSIPIYIQTKKANVQVPVLFNNKLHMHPITNVVSFYKVYQSKMVETKWSEE